MTSKASQRGRRRLERTVATAFGIAVPRRDPHRLAFRVVAKPMLEVRIVIQLANVGDGFRPGAESPLSNGVFRRWSQRLRVPGLRLTRALPRMTTRAHLMTNVLRREAWQKQEH